MDVDSVRFISGPKLNPDGPFPDPNDGTAGAGIAGSGGLVAPPKLKPDVPKLEATGGGGGVEIASVGFTLDPKANGDGAALAKLAVGRTASVFLCGTLMVGCDAKGFGAGAAFPLIFGAPNDEKEKGEGVADVFSVGFGCAEDIPENRGGVGEFMGRENGFGAEAVAALDAGKTPIGFAAVLGAIEGTGDEMPIPANGFGFGALSFLSPAFSSFAANPEGLMDSFVCDEVVELKDGTGNETPTGGLIDGVVDGAAAPEG